MGIVDRDGAKVSLSADPGAFWRSIRAHYAGHNSKRWKALAALALREESGWTCEMIGAALSHPRGHVSRLLRTVRGDLRRVFVRDESAAAAAEEAETA